MKFYTFLFIILIGQEIIYPIKTYSIIPKSKQAINESCLNKNIKIIEAEYEKINSATSLRVIKKRKLEGSTEGGILLCYFNECNELKKATITFYGEMGNISRQYYYKSGILLFCFQRRIDYNMPFSIEGFEEAKIEENRYYFHDQSLIKWTYREENPKLYIDKIIQEDKDPNTPEAQKIANDLLIEAQEFLKEKLEKNEEW